MSECRNIYIYILKLRLEFKLGCLFFFQSDSFVEIIIPIECFVNAMQ